MSTRRTRISRLLRSTHAIVLPPTLRAKISGVSSDASKPASWTKALAFFQPTLEHLPSPGKGECLAHQPPLPLPGRPMPALDIGGMLAQEMANLFRVALDHLDGDSHPAVPGTMLDHPEVVPIGLGLRGPGPSTSTRIFRHPSPGLDHRFPIASLPIAGCDWWRIWMSTGLERSHPSGGDFTLPGGGRLHGPRRPGRGARNWRGIPQESPLGLEGSCRGAL